MKKAQVLTPILIASLIQFLTGCAYFTPAPDDQTFQYITGKNVDNATPNQFEKALTRSRSMAGGNYIVKAFPYTDSYLKAIVRHQSRQRGLTAMEENKVLKKLEAEYTKDKTCFQFRYEVLRYDQSSRLENWKLSLLDSKDEEYPLTWQEADLERAPIMTRVLRSGDKLEQWLGDGVACTYAKVKLNSGFGLKVQPNYVQFPFDSVAKIYWEFPEIKIIDGKEVKVEKKKKSYKAYRGW